MAEALLRIPADVSDELLLAHAQAFYFRVVKPELLPKKETELPIEPVLAEPLKVEPVSTELLEEIPPESSVPLDIDVLPPPPIDPKVFEEPKKPSLESELRAAIVHLSPATVDPESARVIFDLIEARRPVHCVRAGLTDQEKKVWDTEIDAWWSGIGKSQREKFVAQAHRVMSVSKQDDINAELAQARTISYRRMLDGIFSREPGRIYETYEAVKNGKDPFCPLGFSASACDAWKKFLINDWFSTLSVDEKLRMDAVVAENNNAPGRANELKKMLAAKSVELATMDSLRLKISNLFASDKREEHGAKREQLIRQIAEIKREYREIEVGQFLNEEIAQLDAKLHSIGDRSGFGARALDAVKSFFNWTAMLEKIKTPSPLRGRIFGGLSGVYQNVPATVERWMLEAACAETAGALREKRQLSPNAHNESEDDLKKMHSSRIGEGRMEIDWSAYLLALQHRITIEIARATHRGQPLAAAIQKNPLAGLFAAYKEAVPRVAPQFRKQGERLDVLLTELLAQTQADLYVRGRGRAGNIKNLVASNDTHWIQSLLRERAPRDPNEPIAISGHGENASERKGLGLRSSIVVGSQMTSSAIVRTLIKKFDPQKSDVACNRDTLQFMSIGNVSETGAVQNQHFIGRSGADTVSLYVGDRVMAIQDISAPLGFRIEITRNPPPAQQGHILEDSKGRPEWYYQRVLGGRIYAWKFDRAGAKKLAGHLDGRKFVPEAERVWAYRDLKGEKRTVGQFSEDIFFRLDGTVVSKNKLGKGRVFTEIGTLEQPFGNRVTVVASDGSETELSIKPGDQTHFVTPKNIVVTFHASVNEMRELGALKR